jgi:hypothetical protein
MYNHYTDVHNEIQVVLSNEIPGVANLWIGILAVEI